MGRQDSRGPEACVVRYVSVLKRQSVIRWHFSSSPNQITPLPSLLLKQRCWLAGIVYGSDCFFPTEGFFEPTHCMDSQRNVKCVLSPVSLVQLFEKGLHLNAYRNTNTWSGCISLGYINALCSWSMYHNGSFDLSGLCWFCFCCLFLFLLLSNTGFAL